MLTGKKTRQKDTYLDFVAKGAPEEILKFSSLKNQPAMLGSDSFKEIIMNFGVEYDEISSSPPIETLSGFHQNTHPACHPLIPPWPVGLTLLFPPPLPILEQDCFVCDSPIDNDY